MPLSEADAPVPSQPEHECFSPVTQVRPVIIVWGLERTNEPGVISSMLFVVLSSFTLMAAPAPKTMEMVSGNGEP